MPLPYESPLDLMAPFKESPAKALLVNPVESFGVPGDAGDELIPDVIDVPVGDVMSPVVGGDPGIIVTSGTCGKGVGLEGFKDDFLGFKLKSGRAIEWLRVPVMIEITPFVSDLSFDLYPLVTFT